MSELSSSDATLPDDTAQTFGMPPEPVVEKTPHEQYAEKVAELTRQKEEAERVARERDLAQARQVEELSQAVLELKQQLTPKRYDPNDPLGALTDQELHQIALQGPDPENPTKYQLAQDEMFRRRERKLKQEIEERLQREDLRRQHEQALIEQMREKFGEEIMKKGSPLRLAAEKHMAEMQRLHGREIAYDPRAQMAAAAMARAELLEQQLKQKQEGERQRTETLRAQPLRGNQVAPQSNADQTRSILSRKDVPHDQKVKAALKSMNLYDRLFGGGG